MLSRTLPRRCLSSAQHLRTLRTQTLPSRPPSSLQPSTRIPHPSPRRLFATTPTPRAAFDAALVEEKMQEITDLYGTARDEFEIAAEETVKKTVYAEDDRAAAREELEKLRQAFKVVVEGKDRGVAEEVRRRVGGRITELERAVEAMEEAALEE
ncbi:hypothetical protein BU16DRAFT_555685 [Lophium mytilinum]|uniref:Uncharacterized protein n=1 Tax=Lophium mytilinum TaxID=390894 RepID=A0A6A6R9L7_9PEZI|nr:hypothetical protein BU16DRAFT_555685 [Lophium mytilinum]